MYLKELSYVLAIVILIVLFYGLYIAREHMVHGVAYSAGATMRFEQEPTATNQREYDSGYNFRETNILPIPEHSVADIKLARRMEHFDGGYLNQEEILAAQLTEENMTDTGPDAEVMQELQLASTFA